MFLRPQSPASSVLSHIIIDNDPLPLGGEGGPQPALSSAGAGRVRGFLPIYPSSTIGWDRTLAPAFKKLFDPLKSGSGLATTHAQG